MCHPVAFILKRLVIDDESTYIFCQLFHSKTCQAAENMYFTRNLVILILVCIFLPEVEVSATEIVMNQFKRTDTNNGVVNNQNSARETCVLKCQLLQDCTQVNVEMTSLYCSALQAKLIPENGPTWRTYTQVWGRKLNRLKILMHKLLSNFKLFCSSNRLYFQLRFQSSQCSIFIWVP